MKKGYIVVLILIVISLLYWVYAGKSIEEVSKVNLEDISRIVIYDGRGGRFAPLTIDDELNIKEFINLIDRYRVKKIEVVNPSIGWSHAAVFYIDDKRVLDVTFVNPIIINREYYKVIRGDLSTNTIDDFLSPLR